MSAKFRILFIICFLCLVFQEGHAQKFGYVDSDFILKKMPEYKEAQKEIDQLSQKWQKEIQEMYKEIEAMEGALQAEEVLLTVEMQAERESEIRQKREEVKAYQKKVFGFDGLLFLKKKELIKPIQDDIYEAVEKVCKNNRLAMLFDKAGDLVIIYSDPVHDYTDYVLDELGLGEDADQIK